MCRTLPSGQSPPGWLLRSSFLATSSARTSGLSSSAQPLIAYDLGPGAHIEGVRPAVGVQPQCPSFASVPVLDRYGAPVMDHGVPTYREIIPDRNVYGIDDGCIGPSGRYVTDYVVTSPECASYCAHAASTYTTALRGAEAQDEA